MANRQFQVTFSINGSLSSAFNAAMQAAQRGLSGLGRSSRQTQAALNSLRTQQANLLRTQTQIRQYRDAQANLQRLIQTEAQARRSSLNLLNAYQREDRQLQTMRENLNQLRELRRNDRSAVSAAQVRQAQSEVSTQRALVQQARAVWQNQERGVRQANSAVQNQRSQLQSLSSSLAQAGVNVNNLAAAEARLQSQLNSTNSNLSRQENLVNARNNRQQAAQDLSNAYGNFQDSLDTAKTIMSPFTGAVQDAQNFERKMSELRAVSQIDLVKSGNLEQANKNMEILKAQAKDLGRRTIYTGEDVVAAQIKMARTGMQTDAIKNATEPLLKLAAANGAQFDQAADIATNIMMGFGMDMSKMENFSHVADVLSYATSHSNSDLSMLGESMKYAAPVAKNFGSSLEETAAILGVMHDSGIQGSMAGTSLRQTMLRLMAPPKKASKAMEEMGVTMSDAQAQWQEAQAVASSYGVTLDQNASAGKQMASIVRQINESMAGASSQEKMAAFSAITGINAVSGATSLFDRGPEYLDQFTKALENSDGTTEQMYKTMTDNAWGAEESFKSAMDAMSHSVGDALLPAANAAFQFGSQMAQGLDQFIQNNQTAVQWAAILAATLATIMVLASGAALAFAGFQFVASTLAAMAAAMRLSAVATAIWSGITKAAAAAQMLLNGVMMLNPAGLVAAAVLLLVAALAYLISTCPGVSAALSAAWNDPQGAVHGFTQLVKSLVDDAVNYVIDRWNTLKSALSHPIDAALNFLDHGDVIGGNVVSGEQQRASLSPSDGGPVGSPPVDTSQLQASLDAGATSAQQNADAQQQAANASQSFSQTVDQQSQGAQTFSQTISTMGEGITSLQTNLLGLGEGTTAFNTNLTTAATELPILQQNANLAGTELTNLQTQTSATSPQIQQLGTASQGAVAGVQSLGTAASSSASSLSQIASAAGSVASALSAKAAEIGSIHISVPTVSTTPVAANSKGGIYPKGAFLTTFAETSPEAAIPLDKSQRAVNLWTTAGQMLGQLPGNKKMSADTPHDAKLSTIQKAQNRRAETVLQQAKIAKNKTRSPEEIARINKKMEQLERASKYLPGNQQISLPRLSDDGKIFQPVPTFPKQNQPTISPELLNPVPTFPKQNQPTISPELLNPVPTFPKQNQQPAPPRQISFDKLSDRVKHSKSGQALQNALNQKNRTSNSILNKPIQSHDGNLNLGSISPVAPKFGGNILGGSVLDIFKGGIQLPGVPSLQSLNQNQVGDFPLLKNVASTPQSPPPAQSSLPPINLSITINGNADQSTIQQAGQELSFDLVRKLEDWWNDKQRNQKRRSFA